MTPKQQAAQWLADTMKQIAAGRPVSLDEIASMLVIYPGVEVVRDGAVVDWDARPVKVVHRLVIELPWGPPEDSRD